MSASNTTKQLIMQTAFKLFSEKGYEGTSVQEIAQGVGIKAASLYNHFPSKDAIFIACLEDTLRDWSRFGESAVKAAQEHATPEESVAALILTFDEFVRTSGAYQFWTRVYVFPPSILSDKEKGDLQKADMDFYLQVLSFSKGILPEGISEEALQVFTLSLLSMLTGMLINSGGQRLDPAVVTACAAVLVTGTIQRSLA